MDGSFSEYKRYCEELAAQWNRFQGQRRKARQQSYDECFFCGVEMRDPRSQLRLPKSTRDHLFPKSMGGYTTVGSCLICNGRKGNLTLDQYRLKTFNDDTQLFHGENAMKHLLFAFEGFNRVERKRLEARQFLYEENKLCS